MHREPSKHFGLSKTPAIAAIAAVLLLGGCGDFFAAKPTAVQSLAILDELGQVRESPHVNNPLPEIYRQPPSRLTIKDGVKLFYYTRQSPCRPQSGSGKKTEGN